MENIEIRKIKSLEKGPFKAKFDIAFNTSEFDSIVIKGFRIGPSQHGPEPWVEPPSYQVYGVYHHTFFMENKDNWDRLKVAMLKECKQNGIDLGILGSDIDEDKIDISEIPY